METTMAGDDERKRRNLRLALVLASIAAAFFFGIIVKFALLAH
ncbi:MAG TPA: cytochrome oxidase small assembly protein [Ramlibacter sp.]|nr:cytochrome oxidase small assembly protein [Ramlibacter sp.]